MLAPAGDVDALATALDKLITDPQLRRRLGAAGHEHALTNFQSAPAARRFTAIIEAVARGVSGQEVGDGSASSELSGG